MSPEEKVTKVLEALDNIRPFLNKDGGDIELIDVRDDQVFVKLHGNCHGCPMSFSTIKLGVENEVKQKVPSIREVISINY